MDTRELKAFLELARRLHFGRASGACHMSPSALSRMIQRLESEVGAALFVRDNRSVSLTPLGDRFREYAYSALVDWEAFLAGVDEKGQLRGDLSLYASVTAVQSLLPELLAAFREACPLVNLQLSTGVAELAVTQVLSGEMDLAIAALGEGVGERLAFLPLLETPLIFVAPRKQRAGVVWDDCGCLDMAHTPMILPRSGPSRIRLNAYYQSTGIRPVVASEVAGNEAIIALASLGSGVGVVPRIVYEKSAFRDQLVELPDAPSLAPYEVGLCALKRNLRRPLIDAFWRLAESGG